MRPRSACTSALLAALLGVAGCSGQEPVDEGERGRVVVLAAASLSDVLERVAAAYEVEHEGAEVVLSFAGSSQLVQQVRAGAPADVLVTASAATMDDAVEAGAVDGDPAVLATNALAVAVPGGNPAGVTGLADLAREELRVALCAEPVPCGAAAAEAFAAAGITPSPDTLEQDVRAVLSRVRLGEVDAGVVYRTDVLSAGDEVEGVAVPGAERAVEYQVAVLADAPEPEGARAFVALLLGERGRALLEQDGFGPP